MIGVLIGDIVGSRYKLHNRKDKTFQLFDSTCFPTDDSIMTLAVARALLSCKEHPEALKQEAVDSMQKLGRQYLNIVCCGSFGHWILEKHPVPYQSCGNAAAVRASVCGFAAASLPDAIRLSQSVTEVSHNHPEGLKGAQTVAGAVYLARCGSSMEQIRRFVQAQYDTSMDFTLDDIRPSYTYDVTCQGSVPQAIQAFLESTGFEDAIRNAVSIGGDSSSIAAIAGVLAEASYGVPADLARQAQTFLDPSMQQILNQFETQYGCFCVDAPSITKESAR